MSKATEWVMANKVKTGLGLVAALASVVVIPLKVQAWAEDIAEEAAAAAEQRIQEQALIQEGREQAIHSRQEATHRYDFYTLRANEAEEDLIDLEQKAEVEPLTPTEERKVRRLERDLETYVEQKSKALEALQKQEHDHGTTDSQTD